MLNSGGSVERLLNFALLLEPELLEQPQQARMDAFLTAARISFLATRLLSSEKLHILKATI